MTAQQPQGAPNPTGSVPGDGPDPYRATQGARTWPRTPEEPNDVKALTDADGNTWVPDTDGWNFPHLVGAEGVRPITWLELLEFGPLTAAANSSTLGTAP